MSKIHHRRPRGHIRHRGRNSWELKVELSPDAFDRRRVHTETFRGTPEDAEKALTKLVSQVDEGAFAPPAREVLKDMLQDWLAYKVERRAPEETTMATYRTLIKNVIGLRIVLAR